MHMEKFLYHQHKQLKHNKDFFHPSLHLACTESLKIQQKTKNRRIGDRLTKQGQELSSVPDVITIQWEKKRQRIQRHHKYRQKAGKDRGT